MEKIFIEELYRNVLNGNDVYESFKRSCKNAIGMKKERNDSNSNDDINNNIANKNSGINNNSNNNNNNIKNKFRLFVKDNIHGMIEIRQDDDEGNSGDGENVEINKVNQNDNDTINNPSNSININNNNNNNNNTIKLLSLFRKDKPIKYKINKNEIINNVPKPSKQFNGRYEIINDIITRLIKMKTRMLTLTGVKGIGKTEICYKVSEIAQKKKYFHRIYYFDCKKEITEFFERSKRGNGNGINDVVDDNNNGDNSDNINNNQNINKSERLTKTNIALLFAKIFGFGEENSDSNDNRNSKNNKGDRYNMDKRRNHGKDKNGMGVDKTNDNDNNDSSNMNRNRRSSLGVSTLNMLSQTSLSSSTPPTPTPTTTISSKQNQPLKSRPLFKRLSSGADSDLSSKIIHDVYKIMEKNDEILLVIDGCESFTQIDKDGYRMKSQSEIDVDMDKDKDINKEEDDDNNNNDDNDNDSNCDDNNKINNNSNNNSNVDYSKEFIHVVRLINTIMLKVSILSTCNCVLGLDGMNEIQMKIEGMGIHDSIEMMMMNMMEEEEDDDGNGNGESQMLSTSSSIKSQLVEYEQQQQKSQASPLLRQHLLHHKSDILSYLKHITQHYRTNDATTISAIDRKINDMINDNNWLKEIGIVNKYGNGYSNKVLDNIGLSYVRFISPSVVFGMPRYIEYTVKMIKENIKKIMKMENERVYDVEQSQQSLLSSSLSSHQQHHHDYHLEHHPHLQQLYSHLHHHQQQQQQQHQQQQQQTSSSASTALPIPLSDIEIDTINKIELNIINERKNIISRTGQELFVEANNDESSRMAPMALPMSALGSTIGSIISSSISSGSGSTLARPGLTTTTTTTITTQPVITITQPTTTISIPSISSLSSSTISSQLPSPPLIAMNTNISHANINSNINNINNNINHIESIRTILRNAMLRDMDKISTNERITENEIMKGIEIWERCKEEDEKRNKIRNRTGMNKKGNNENIAVVDDDDENHNDNIMTSQSSPMSTSPPIVLLSSSSSLLSISQSSPPMQSSQLQSSPLMQSSSTYPYTISWKSFVHQLNKELIDHLGLNDKDKNKRKYFS